MNALASNLPGERSAPILGTVEPRACFHCGLPAPADTHLSVMFSGTPRAMCCIGCASVAETIIAAGLSDYYTQRDALPDAGRTRALASDAARILEERVQSAPIATGGALATTDAGAPPLHEQAALYVSGMHCAACAWLAERAVRMVPGVVSASVNLTTHTGSIEFDPRRCTLSDLANAMARVGLGAERIEAADRVVARARERRQLWLQFGVAALCMMQVMMLVIPMYIARPGEIEADSARLMTWAAWLLTLPVLLYSARPILYRGLAELRLVVRSVAARMTDAEDAQSLERLGVSMDTPIAVALVATFATSTWSLITADGHHYFDAISMFVTLILGARLLESGLRSRTADSIERLANARPLVAQRIGNWPIDETATPVAARALKVGDVVVVGPGEIVPADGIVLRGSSELDEALLTGEPRPVLRELGAEIVAGSVNTHSPLVVKVTAANEDTVVAGISRRVEANLTERTPFESPIVARLTEWVAPATLLIALAAGLLWLILDPSDPSHAFDVAVAVLVVTCPCALALAAPTVQAAALAQMLRHGMLVSRGHVAAALSEATDVVFDKTGTLTQGKMRVVDVRWGAPSEHCAAIVEAMERHNRHPLADALRVFVQPFTSQSGEHAVSLSSVQSVPGRGLEAEIAGKRYRLGGYAFAHAATEEVRPSNLSDESDKAACGSCEPRALTWLYLTQFSDADCITLAQFALEDPLREEAKEVVSRLHRRGIRVHLLSGDAEQPVLACANALGIGQDRVRARLTPSEKQAYVLTLRDQGACVVAMGDGTNDAPMLSAAGAGIGLGSGSRLAALSADAVQSTARGSVLSGLQAAMYIATRARRIVNQNLAWALAYNAIAVPAAIVGVVTPLTAAIGMAASSMMVVLNASRLRLDLQER
ncbi:MAG: heavy metal translocating P-type ATPase [Burkholderiales bacterium]|nr:heavy metal translocating P-type ATPase [Nitrosomonadaceae bacterium]